MLLKAIISRCVFTFICIACIASAHAQDRTGRAAEAEELPVQRMVEERRFVFVAQQALPLRGPMIPLTTLYQVVVSGDTLRSDLPYFGRAFTAPVDPTRGGIQFETTNYKYKAKSKRRRGWTFTIEPEQVQDVQQLNFSFFANGSANLQVISMNRQPISFYGYIKEQDSPR